MSAANTRRAIVIILDSLGVGALPDAADYGDAGAATLQHVVEACDGLKLSSLQSLGLGNITSVEGLSSAGNPLAVLDKLSTSSKGKDTITGHWELMGLVSERAFPLYPEGFPPEVMGRFTELTGHAWLGNYPASGTEIIAQLGSEHVATGKPIVYTSGDSVFQIAAHTDIIPLKELYRICEITREEVLIGEHACARVIARPFVGSEQDGFVRTADRHDYALSPLGPTALERLQQAGVQTLCIGKISDIFNGHGVDVSWSTRSNAEGMQMLDRALTETAQRPVTESAGEFSAELSDESGDNPSDDAPDRDSSRHLIFANLVDFDMLWGHRRDPQGYGQALEEFDQWLADFLPKLTDSDLLIITADHGCDPTHKGTDHTREYVPLLIYGPAASSFNSANDAEDGSHDLTKVATIIEDYLLEGTERVAAQ